MMPILRFLLIFAFAGVALADDDPPCACVAKGKRWAQGDSVCIEGRTLTCGMTGNVSAWLTVNKACVPEQAQSDVPMSKAEKSLL